MKTFAVQNAIDNHTLSGLQFEAPESPKAVISLVHGFGEHGGRYESFAEALAKKGIAVVSVDLHGHGKTDGKRGVCHSYEALLGDVDALIDKTRSLYPGAPQFLFGHSMGGGLVLNYIMRRGANNLSGVIVSAPLLKPADPLPGFQMAALKIIRKIMPNFTADAGLDSGAISTLEAEVEKYNDDPLVHGTMGAGLAVDVIGQGEWALKNAEKWDAPLLLYHAPKDALTRYDASEDFARRAKNCEFHSFENAFHEMHNDVCREEVFDMIDSFISERS